MTSRNPKRSPRQGRWVLMVLSVTLLMSGLLRLGNGTGAAIAREIELLREEESATPQACEPLGGVKELMQAINAREIKVRKNESALEDRMVALLVAETKIQKTLAALVAAEQALATTMTLADSASENDLSQLTAVYENMKAKDAAILFEEMEPEFAAGFLGRMRPETAAAIMTGLSPKSAYAASAILAGRNALVPTD